ncbi:MAG TPA: bifunctional phosphoribosyl-AMP cyclohydrolase/phosphoribosyl-ATP diphosphatase HisIE [Pyrinomonadaceae bacterium]|nr:bifunctional phosphoribosyl-AMP cyclohydrolase/phosphoribosyl-ATP diphosphatase HisIE [Pyrinomonadaceae bacterium]
MNFKIEDLKFDEHGLIPAIVQDTRTGDVLMLAYMNVESLRRTIDTSETWFWSRSRNKLWHKGETSGNTQTVTDIRFDCDRDALLVIVRPHGPACHTGRQSCFHNRFEDKAFEMQADASATPDTLEATLDNLYSLLSSRYCERPAGSYTTRLFDEGIQKILAKVDEESQETIVAGRSESNQRLVEETSDLLYHLLVLLVQRGVRLSDIREELTRRRRQKPK